VHLSNYGALHDACTCVGDDAKEWMASARGMHEHDGEQLARQRRAAARKAWATGGVEKKRDQLASPDRPERPGLEYSSGVAGN